MTIFRVLIPSPPPRIEAATPFRATAARPPVHPPSFKELLRPPPPLASPQSPLPSTTLLAAVGRGGPSNWPSLPHLPRPRGGRGEALGARQACVAALRCPPTAPWQSQGYPLHPSAPGGGPARRQWSRVHHLVASRRPIEVVPRGVHPLGPPAREHGDAGCLAGGRLGGGRWEAGGGQRRPPTRGHSGHLRARPVATIGGLVGHDTTAPRHRPLPYRRTPCEVTSFLPPHAPP